MGNFDWPCYKREAHKAHVIDSTEDLERLADVQLTELTRSSPWALTGLQCPGVKAHPDTMIGRP